MTRVVVVGQGPAGLLVADWLSQLGWDVAVIAASEGTLSLWSGQWDFRNYDEHRQPISDPWAWWASTSTRSYAEDWNEEDWKPWWRALIQIWQRLGLAVSDELPRENRWIITPTGRLRPTFLSPPWLWQTRLDPVSAVLVGFDGLADDGWRWLQGRLPNASLSLVDVKILDRPPTWRPYWSALSWAAFLDGGQGREWLKQALDPHRLSLPQSDILIFPEVLGFSVGQALAHEISRWTGRPVFEYGLMPPAIGGIRIRDRWLTDLKARGVAFYHGRVERLTPGIVHGAGGRIFEADHVVLATGGLLGGGVQLASDGRLVNSATGEAVPWNGSEQALVQIGLGVDGPGYRVVGRAVGQTDSDRFGDGGALTVWSAAETIRALVDPARVQSWLREGTNAP
jgi:anaerobic glycerol-3-phosphate dehydrogenase